MNQDKHDTCPTPAASLPPNRTIEFHSELSLAAFIREAPGKWSFRVEEKPSRAGHYTLTFL